MAGTTDKKGPTCRSCGATFSTREALRRHIYETHIGGGEKTNATSNDNKDSSSKPRG